MYVYHELFLGQTRMVPWALCTHDDGNEPPNPACRCPLDGESTAWYCTILYCVYQSSSSGIWCCHCEGFRVKNIIISFFRGRGNSPSKPQLQWARFMQVRPLLGRGRPEILMA